MTVLTSFLLYPTIFAIKSVSVLVVSLTRIRAWCIYHTYVFLQCTMYIHTYAVWMYMLHVQTELVRGIAGMHKMNEPNQLSFFVAMIEKCFLYLRFFVELFRECVLSPRITWLRNCVFPTLGRQSTIGEWTFSKWWVNLTLTMSRRAGDCFLMPG